MSIAQVQAAKALIAVDPDSAALKRISLDWGAAYRDAVTLAANHTAATGCSSLDILHCAVAKAIRANDFINTDGRQIRLAEEMGLPYSPI